MTPNYINSIARTIQSQLLCGSNRMKVWSWGAHNYKAVIANGKAALQFTVQGYLYKGRITIAYDEGTDTYEIFKGLKKRVMVYDNVYCDCMTDLIDKMVESGKGSPYNP